MLEKTKKFINEEECIKYYFERWCQIESLYKLLGTGLISFPDQSLSDLKYKTYYKINNKKLYFYYPYILKILYVVLVQMLKMQK